MTFVIFATYPHGENSILSCFWVSLSIAKVIVKAFTLEKRVNKIQSSIT
jgi:hypothetical protein